MAVVPGSVTNCKNGDEVILHSISYTGRKSRRQKPTYVSSAIAQPINQWICLQRVDCQEDGAGEISTETLQNRER